MFLKIDEYCESCDSIPLQNCEHLCVLIKGIVFDRSTSVYCVDSFHFRCYNFSIRIIGTFDTIT